MSDESEAGPLRRRYQCADDALSEKEKRDEGTFVDLNVGGLQAIRERAEARRRTSELMTEL